MCKKWGVSSTKSGNSVKYAKGSKRKWQKVCPCLHTLFYIAMTRPIELLLKSVKKCASA